MWTRYFLGLVTFILPIGLSAQSIFPDHCPDGSALPFSAIEIKHAIDDTCGLDGKKTASGPSHLQNKAKNNFCASATSGTPEAVTPASLVALQASTTVPSGFKKEPSDRGPLTALGEGKLVRMKAFLIEAHHADLGAGETVNCNGGTEPKNDIHMAMGSTADAQECESVSAEISPHYRPKSWNEIGHFEIYNSSTHEYVPNPALDARLTAHSYRVTGQLFFDASHTICPCGTTCKPTRASGWEIHPVYNIEVCKAGAACDEGTDSDWMAFDTWWNSLVPLKKPKPPHAHTESPH